MKQFESHWSCQGLVSLIPGTARPNTFNLYLRIPDLLNDLMWRTKYMHVATWVFQWIFRTPVLCYSRSVIIVAKKLFNNIRIQFRSVRITVGQVSSLWGVIIVFNMALFDLQLASLIFKGVGTFFQGIQLFSVLYFVLLSLHCCILPFQLWNLQFLPL